MSFPPVSSLDRRARTERVVRISCNAKFFQAKNGDQPVTETPLIIGDDRGNAIGRMFVCDYDLKIGIILRWGATHCFANEVLLIVEYYDNRSLLRSCRGVGRLETRHASHYLLQPIRSQMRAHR